MAYPLQGNLDRSVWGVAGPKHGKDVMANAIAVLVFVAAAALFLSPRLRASTIWRATVTPLASIIGSGFLVSLPLLAEDMGTRAILGMMGLCAGAYALGSAIRFNIRHGETLFEKRDHHALNRVENLSHLALAGAYFISVTYYLTLLSSFALKGFGFVDPFVARLLTTILLLLLGGYGVWKDLRGLESVEEYAVGLKLAVIAAVLAALAFFNVSEAIAGEWRLPEVFPAFTWHTVRELLGLLIIVQGFETSRFLRDEYDAQTRIRTMRYAQIISTAIYAAFFLLATVTIGQQTDRQDIAAVTSMLAGVASILPLILIGGSICAQASAAVADAIGASGLLTEAKLLKRHTGYPVVAAAGILLVWTVDVFGVISLASRAFALFYFLQCIVAVTVLRDTSHIKYRRVRQVGFSLLALITLAVVVYGIPAEAGG